MQEETGYLPQKLASLGGYYLAPGYSTEFLYLYLATDLLPSRLVAEDTEGINIVRVPVSQIRKMLASGKICDGKSIAGLYMYLEYKKKNPNLNNQDPNKSEVLKIKNLRRLGNISQLNILALC